MPPLRRAHVLTSEHVRVLWTITSRRSTARIRQHTACTMKRLASSFTEFQSSKRARIGSPGSHGSGEALGANWPAKKEEIEAARRLILEWSDPNRTPLCLHGCLCLVVLPPNPERSSFLTRTRMDSHLAQSFNGLSSFLACPQVLLSLTSSKEGITSTTLRSGRP